MSVDPEAYDELFPGPLRRRIGPLVVRCRGAFKTALNLSRHIHVMMRWRLGDEVMAIPVYQALRREHPRNRVSVSCNYPELLEDNPFVDAVNPPRPRPDRIVVLRGAPRDRFRLECYAERAGIPVPSARPRLYYNDWSSPALDGLPRAGQTLVALAPGASWPTKRWPADSWRALAAALIARGHDVVGMGVADDPDVGSGHSLRGRTGVRDAACVLRAARLLVACDSGLMHLALAAGTPVLALFGPTDPGILIRDEPLLTVMSNERDCRGCWNAGRMADPGVCPLGVADCMETVSSDRVLECVEGILNRES